MSCEEYSNDVFPQVGVVGGRVVSPDTVAGFDARLFELEQFAEHLTSNLL